MKLAERLSTTIYGGLIRTPNIKRIADQGLTYTNSTPRRWAHRPGRA
jgi:hypothetical protein